MKLSPKIDLKISRKISIVAATFVLAAATGQYMQQSVHRAPQPAPQPAPRVASVALPTHVVPLSAQAEQKPTPDAALRAALPKLPVLKVSLPAALADAPSPAIAPASAAATCHPDATLSVDEGAILKLSLKAPCHADQRVVVRHAGLAFTALTDAKGDLSVRVPAMEEAAKVTVMFPGGQTVSANTSVPELSLYDRVAVQWVGNDAFTLHALEFDADFGEDGDISPKNPGTPSPMAEATEGFMVTLGNDTVELPMLAQVYTYPTRLSAQDGKIRIVIDADATPRTCGREMLAETLRVQHDGAPKTSDLSVAMPACGAPDATDSFVELRGLVPDIRVAGS